MHFFLAFPWMIEMTDGRVLEKQSAAARDVGH
jgi:hypothetical protein